jgi:type III pantothenate kinase
MKILTLSERPAARNWFKMVEMHDKSRAPKIESADLSPKALIAVDIGNSGIKFGRFSREDDAADNSGEAGGRTMFCLPEPTSTIDLPIAHATGEFDSAALAKWCEANASSDTRWSVGSVHRGAAALLSGTLSTWAKELKLEWPIRALAYQALPLKVRVDEPAKVGIDRLLAALAANRLRATNTAAIVIDLGTAITVDLVEADGAFAGGAILPGISMASRALAEQTDALPHVVLDDSKASPSPLGKSTITAIEAGLYWGTVGAVTQLVSQLSIDLATSPDVFITGGAAPIVIDALSKNVPIRYEPHLVLSGIALLESSVSPAHRG